jgi:hypothetical protein
MDRPADELQITIHIQLKTLSIHIWLTPDPMED